MNGPLRLVGGTVLIAAWIGAALIVAASVAPAAFAVLPSRALAGNVVGRVLPVVFIAGLFVGLGAAWLGAGGSRARPALAALIAVACGVAQFVIAPRIARLRADIGPSLDALAVDDARRVAFGRLHAFSVGWLGVAMLAATIYLIISLLAMRQRFWE